jgi:murein DD-endopeptidase MepM/ murein hydrolase activator NlpD
MNCSKKLIIFILISIAVSACSVKKGQYVYWKKQQRLSEIAGHYNVSIDEIKKVNPKLAQGNWIFIPNKVGILDELDNTSAVEDYSFVGSGEFIWPVPRYKKISSSFGRRWGKNHDGIDIPAPTGTPIVAVRDGLVKYSDNRVSGYGNMVILDHGKGIYSVYAHCDKNFVDQGSRVKQGQKIATVGSTGRSSGPHLHFEIRTKNKARNPANYL